MNAAALPYSSAQTGIRLLWTGLIVVMACFIFGMLGTVLGKQEAFATLSDEMANPEQLSRAIGHVLHSQLIGLVGANVGALLYGFALIQYRLRQRWMFWVAVVLTLLVPPVGWAVLIFCLMSWREFFTKPGQQM